MNLEYIKIYIKKVFLDKNSYGINLKNKFRMNIAGFTADQYARFNLKNNNAKEYISEYERWKTRKINGRYNIVLDDKLLFYDFFKQYVSIPENYAWINQGNIYNLDEGAFSKEDIFLLLEQKKKLIIKPVIAGGSGKGVSLLAYTDNQYELNFEIKSPEEIFQFIKNCNDFLISEFINQHEYSKKIFDKSVNTIRILTTKENGKTNIIDAVHRFGVNECIPVDNAAKGALVTQINIKNGRLGESKTFFNDKPITHHPNTNVMIEGVQVPNWNSVKASLVKTHSKFPYIKFIAWDVVITDNGFSVIEGNASTGLNIFQLWKGCRNTALGEFYKRQGIID